jgi:hypothetical protein
MHYFHVAYYVAGRVLKIDGKKRRKDDKERIGEQRNKWACKRDASKSSVGAALSDKIN